MERERLRDLRKTFSFRDVLWWLEGFFAAHGRRRRNQMKSKGDVHGSRVDQVSPSTEKTV